MAIVTPLIGRDSLVRLGNPVPISFDKATLVAVLGLIVNLVTAYLRVLASGKFAQQTLDSPKCGTIHEWPVWDGKAMPQQRPERIAEAVTGLLDIPFGQRPFSTVVGYVGVGPVIERYNDVLHDLTLNTWTNFGIEHMLYLNV